MTDVTSRRSFRPGTWFGVFGDHATVLLPGSEKARVAALWELVDEGAGFDEVLDALISGGLRELPGFVLVSEMEADTKVVVRGAARAVFVSGGEEVTLEGSQATTWVERTLPSVTAMQVDVEDAPDGDHLSVENGLVRVSRVEVGTPIEAFAPDPVPVQPVPLAEPVDAPEAEVAPEPEPEPEAEPQAEPAAYEPPPAPEPAPEPVPQPDPEPDTSPNPLPDEPAPAVSDHDGHTRFGEVSNADFVPGFGQAPPGPAVVSRPVARLALSSGETLDVDRAIIVGRAPEARRFPAAEQPRLVSVPSPQQEISSTHVEFRPGSGADHGSAVVTDLGSTNGTVLVQPGLPPEDLQPGIAVQLIPGAIVDLGDGVTIQVLNP